AVVTKLKDAKIPYELADGGVIRVATAQVQEARLATVGLGLNGKPATGSGFELFNTPSFGQTEFTQKVNYQRALENELARSIDQMDAVESSRVHLVMPQQTLFTTQQKDTTASVILKLKPGKRFDTAQARSISNLVAGSVEGLKPANLTIVDVNGNTLSVDDGAGSTAGLTSKQLDMQHSYESTAERNLQAMLDRVLGSGKATVRVAAVMNWDQTEQTSETYSPGDPNLALVRTSHDITDNSNGGTSGVGGVPGAASNNGAIPTYQGASTAGSTATRTDSDKTFELNKVVKKVVTAPGAVTRQSVSVVVDDDPNNPNPALVQSVQTAVNAAAGIDATRGDLLTVTAIPFNRDELVTTQAAMADAAQKEQLMGYLHLAALVVGPLLLLAVLFFVLSRGRKQKPTKAEALALNAAQTTIVEVPEPAPATPMIGRPRKPGSTSMAQPIAEDPQKVYIREQIQALGKSNPATVAQLIQTWMDEDRRN
ncbi:MAG TPA: flagellar basal-body MS-ring/collar protein FliF, partial [Chloroflexota bacterium]|nr:flagellar basal-body MS-ring/collar protein FliF [Chloroflexota bacterium]